MATSQRNQRKSSSSYSALQKSVHTLAASSLLTSTITWNINTDVIHRFPHEMGTLMPYMMAKSHLWPTSFQDGWMERKKAKRSKVECLGISYCAAWHLTTTEAFSACDPRTCRVASLHLPCEQIVMKLCLLTSYFWFMLRTRNRRPLGLIKWSFEDSCSFWCSTFCPCSCLKLSFFSSKFS